MSGGSQVHIFWGAPVSPLEMTVSQEPTSVASTAETWKEIQVLYNHHSLYLKDEKCRHKNLEDCQALEPLGLPDLPHGHFPANSMNRSVHMKDDTTHRISEAQTVKSQKAYPLGMSDRTSSSEQERGFKGGVQHFTEEEKYQKLSSELRKTRNEQHDQSNMCGQNIPKNPFHLAHKCAAILDAVCGAEQTNTPEAIKINSAPAEHHEIQNQCLEFFLANTGDKPRPEGTVGKASGVKISTDTEFLSIMTSSQVAFLAQRKYKGQKSINKGTINMEIEPEANYGEIRITEDNLIQSKDDSAGGNEDGQNQACSLELFSPVCPETKSSHTLLNTDKDLEENITSQELFNCDDKFQPNEILIESCNSGILCSQLNTFCKSSGKRSWTSEDKSGHPQALSEVPHVAKKIKLFSNERDHTVTVDRRNMFGFKGIKKTSLIKNCDSEHQKYNCLVMVLSPCHMKEINIKSGPNSGSKVPLATIVVTDQSEIKKKVFLWRTAAFWALTVFLGDIILLTGKVIVVNIFLFYKAFSLKFLVCSFLKSRHPECQILKSLECCVGCSWPGHGEPLFLDVTIHEDHWVGETVLQSTFTSQLLNLGSYSSVQPEEYSSMISNVVLQDLLAYVSSKHSYLRDLPQRHPQKMSSIEFIELEQLQPDILVHAILRVVDITVLTEALYSYRGQKQRKVMLTVEQTQGQHYVLVLWGPGAAWYPQLQRKKGVILIKAQILELVFPVAAVQKIALNARSSLKSIFSSLPNIIYTGCAKCGLELQTDENKIYKQCFSCLPFTMKKIYYRPALMTIVDGKYKVCIHVGSKLIEKILLNISPDWLNRVIAPPCDVTYGMAAADLLHALLAGSGAPCVLKVQSLFVLDENSYPLQQDFSLLDFYLNDLKHASHALL
ncbi:shieldin complex subunit 2 isoform X7 [Bos indicus]|uniref:Shieldin complex subunit 2 isoform X7 n=1 Tax=Bos indicus TaxID=9915 RepID=A0ABM4RS52_BOSIN